jgi:hypothetical protein
MLDGNSTVNRSNIFSKAKKETALRTMRRQLTTKKPTP